MNVKSEKVSCRALQEKHPKLIILEIKKSKVDLSLSPALRLCASEIRQAVLHREVPMNVCFEEARVISDAHKNLRKQHFFKF